MKKLLIAVTAAASAFGLYAADAGFVSGTSFDDDGMVGINTIGALNANDGDAWSTTDDAAAFEVKNYDAAGETASTDRPAKWVGEKTQANFLEVKTKLDKTLTRAFSPAQQLSAGDVYVDTLVKFTACDEEITTLADSAAKLAVWVKEDETTGKTNLMVTAGYVNSLGGAVEPKNYDCGTFSGLDAWHRLTIKSIGDITASKGLVGFVVFVDGVAKGYATADESIGIDGYKDLLTPVATLWDKAGNLFPSLKGTGDGSISAIALSGQGKIDDITFTTTAPTFAEKGTVTFTWTPADFTVIEIGNETVDVTKGSYVCEYKAGQTYTISATPVEGKMVTSAPSFKPDEAGKSFEITAAGIAATVTIDGVPTEYTDLGNAITAIENATAAATLKLGADAEAIEIDNSNEIVITIDLNGKTITATGDDEYGIFVSGSSVVVIDSASNGTVDGTEAIVGSIGSDLDVTLDKGIFKGAVGCGETLTVANGVKGDETAKESIELADDQEWSEVGGDGLYTVQEWQPKCWADVLGVAVDGAYQIEDKKDLLALATYVGTFETAGITFKQTANIDLAGIAWLGIGAANNKDNIGTEATYKAGAFQGTYDGGNFTVSNITLSREDYIGFFGSLYNATVKNLKLSAAGTGYAETGSLSADWSGGLAVGVSVKSTIENVETLAGQFTAEKAAAGIVGYAAGGTVLKGCVNRLNVTSVKNEKVAGLVACAQNSGDYTPAELVIDGCSNYGNVECQASGKIRAALLVSYTDFAVKFQGTITARGTVTQAGSTENIQSIININGGSATVVDGAVITAPDSMKSTIHNGKAHAGLNYATYAEGVATFVADAALANGNTYKVMTTGNTVAFNLAAADDWIAFDQALATATLNITSATGEIATNDTGTVRKFTAKAAAPSGVEPGKPVGLGNPGTIPSLEEAQKLADKLSPVPTAEQTADGITAADLQVKAVFTGSIYQAVAEPADKWIPEVKTEGEDVQPIEVTADDFSATIKNAKKGFYYGFVAADELKADVEFAPAATFEKATGDGALKLTAPKAETGNARFYKLSVSAVPVTVE